MLNCEALRAWSVPAQPIWEMSVEAKKDWCKEHDRPDSQCFVCHPEYKQVFIGLYKAKYGKEPPAPGEDEHNDDHEHEESKASEKR